MRPPLSNIKTLLYIPSEVSLRLKFTHAVSNILCNGYYFVQYFTQYSVKEAEIRPMTCCIFEEGYVFFLGTTCPGALPALMVAMHDVRMHCDITKQVGQYESLGLGS